jgi:hypothetical protein
MSANGSPGTGTTGTPTGPHPTAPTTNVNTNNANTTITSTFNISINFEDIYKMAGTLDPAKLKLVTFEGDDGDGLKYRKFKKDMCNHLEEGYVDTDFL